MTDYTTIVVADEERDKLDEAAKELFDDPDETSYADVVEALIASHKFNF